MRKNGPEQIFEQLKELKALDTDLKVFGANKHKYDLNPVLSDSEISAIESRYEIKLPDDYRWFLLNIGNGGAGPNYGILTLQESIYEITSNLDEDEDNTISHKEYLSTPFERPMTLERSKRMHYFVEGMIPVSDAGCCMYYHLCISGSEYGNIWFWSNDNVWRPVPHPDDRPTFPENAKYGTKEYGEVYNTWYSHLLDEKHTYRNSFMDWYQLWLKDAFEKIRNP